MLLNWYSLSNPYTSYKKGGNALALSVTDPIFFHDNDMPAGCPQYPFLLHGRCGIPLKTFRRKRYRNNMGVKSFSWARTKLCY